MKKTLSIIAAAVVVIYGAIKVENSYKQEHLQEYADEFASAIEGFGRFVGVDLKAGDVKCSNSVISPFYSGFSCEIDGVKDSDKMLEVDKITLNLMEANFNFSKPNDGIEALERVYDASIKIDGVKYMPDKDADDIDLSELVSNKKTIARLKEILQNKDKFFSFDLALKLAFDDGKMSLNVANPLVSSSASISFIHDKKQNEIWLKGYEGCVQNEQRGDATLLSYALLLSSSEVFRSHYGFNEFLRSINENISLMRTKAEQEAAFDFVNAKNSGYCYNVAIKNPNKILSKEITGFDPLSFVFGSARGDMEISIKVK